MICIVCQTDKPIEEIDPGTRELEVGHICKSCLDEKVAEIKAREQASIIVQENLYRVEATENGHEFSIRIRHENDWTPIRLKPDVRCQLCRQGHLHSEWAHEDGIEGWHDQQPVVVVDSGGGGFTSQQILAMMEKR